MSGQGNFDFMDPPKGRAESLASGNARGRDSDRRMTGWLGLVTSHRRLFDASQDGWLRPPAGSCFLLGRESFVSEDSSAGRNAIPVRLAFDIDKLPFQDVRKDLERAAVEHEHGDVPRVVRWRAPIPLYAVTTVEVLSDEERTHLLAMAGQFSNLSLPDAAVTVTDFAPEPPPADDSGAPETRPLELPETLNAIQGAMAMAVWAVPHVEPWIEVLRHALGQDAPEVAEETALLDAQWLQIPWLVRDLSASPRNGSDEQARLWQSALTCMKWPNAGEESPVALADRIAQAACLGDTSAWLERTRRIVAGNETVSCDGWRANGAGLAIWLALLRPDPMRFRSWNQDLPGLPPGAWWAAATLCGWRHGYRALDTEFRGGPKLREFIATRALEAAWPDGEEAGIPASQCSPLERAHDEGSYTLAWRGEPILRKQWKARAKWYAADLTDTDTDKAARQLAGRLAWPCIERRLPLPEGRLRADGSGHWFVDGDDLVVEGGKSLRLPGNIDIEERVDPDMFRLRLATESGEISDPPDVFPRPFEAVAGPVMEPPEAYRAPSETEDVVATDLPPTDRARSAIEPPGLIYRPDFITEKEEAKLLERIDRAEWSTELQRRVQQYGWYYDYKERRINESVRVPEFPDWARELGRKLVDNGLMNDLPDQLIVNEYVGNQGITPHTDHEKDFTERIATISLLETWVMNFHRTSDRRKLPKHLERRSVAILTGDARYKWKHEIPQRKTEPPMGGKGKRTPRSRRISLTFRTSRFSLDA